MTKRRHPTPVGQRRPGAGQGRRRLRALEMSALADPPDYFDERFALLQEAYDRGSAVTKLVAGRFIPPRHGWAQHVHLRQCIAVDSILALARFQPRMDAGEECTLDQSSIASLARGVAESACMVAYIIDPSLTPAEWELRKEVLWFHDATTRYKMFKNWDDEEQAEGFRQARAEILVRIEAADEFKALPQERQTRIRSGSEMYVYGLRATVRLLGWQVKEFDGMYAYLSSHAHSAPVSFLRFAEQGVDFQKPTKAQRTTAAFAMEFACSMLNITTEKIATLFEVEVPGSADHHGADRLGALPSPADEGIEEA